MRGGANERTSDKTKQGKEIRQVVQQIREYNERRKSKLVTALTHELEKKVREGE